MTGPIKFGRQAAARPAFQINELTFSGLPLSLAEEKQLAETGAGENDADMVDAVLNVLADVLNARVEDKTTVTKDWLLDNLATSDLEGIVEYLRSGSTGTA